MRRDLRARLEGGGAQNAPEERLYAWAPAMALGVFAVAGLGAYLALGDSVAAKPKPYAIMFYSSPSCGWCKKIKRDVLPRWRETEAAKLAGVSVRDPVRDCQDAGVRGAACRAVYGETRFYGVPSFALVDMETGETVARGRGFRGFTTVNAALESRVGAR